MSSHVVEEMISLSRVIKTYTSPMADREKKEIGLKKVRFPQIEGSDGQEDDQDTSDVMSTSNEKADYEASLRRREEQLQQREQRLHDDRTAFERQMADRDEEIRKQAEETFNQAAEEGFNQGYQDGLEQGQAQFSEAVQEAKQIIELARQDVVRRIEEAEPDILELAVAIAARITGTELEQDSSKWLQFVKQAIYEVREQDEVKVYVPPHWYPITLEGQPELQEVAVHVGELIILPDEQLVQNQCFLETPYGRVDASMDTQLLEVRHALFEVLKAGG